MKSTIVLKGLASVAAVAILVPAVASAHDFGAGTAENGNADAGLHIGGLHLGLGADVKAGAEVKHDGGNDNDGDDGHVKAHASTTASGAITKKANRIELMADVLGSIGATLEGKLASTTASSTADISALNSGIANSKVQAHAAINLVAGSSTDATVLAQAEVDVKAAQGFLNDARKALAGIWRTVISVL